MGLGILLAKLAKSDLVFFKVNSGVTFDANKALDKGLEAFNQNPQSSLSPFGEKIYKAINVLTKDVENATEAVKQVTSTSSFNWFNLGISLTIFVLALSTCYFAYRYFKLKKSFLSYEASTLRLLKDTQKLVDGVSDSHKIVTRNGLIATNSLRNMTLGLNAWNSQLQQARKGENAARDRAIQVISKNVGGILKDASSKITQKMKNETKLLSLTAEKIYKKNASNFKDSYLPGSSASFNRYKNRPANVLFSCLAAFAIVGLLQYGYADLIKADFCQYLQTHNFYLPFEQHCITIKDIKYNQPDFVNLKTTTVSIKGEKIMDSSNFIINRNARMIPKDLLQSL